MIDLRGTRIDVHVRIGSKCTFDVSTGIDLTGAVLHASVTDTAGARLCTLDVAILSPATAGVVRLSTSSPTALSASDAPTGVLGESTSLEWSLARHVVDGVTYYHEPLAYGTFATSGRAGVLASES